MIAELEEMESKTRKVMTIKLLHLKSYTDGLYVSRNRGGRGLIGCWIYTVNLENRLRWYVKK